MVTGSDKPLTVNAELFALAAVTVTLAPLALKLPEAVPLEPTTTLPSEKDVGEIANWPACGDAPVPDSGIVKVGFGAFELTVTLPLAAPLDCGAKVTEKLVLWPAVSVFGVVIPLMLNPVPLAAAEEIVTLVPPVFVTVSVIDC
jgi:hypothetical protein